MRTPKVYTIQATWVWELVETTYSQEGFVFYPDADIEFATEQSPEVDEIVPVLEGEKHWFEKPISFYVKGTAWTKIFLTPFNI